MEDSIILKFIVWLTAIIALIFAIRKVCRLFFPIRITPSIHFPSDKSVRGHIGAEIVNKSRETQYVVRCEARGTYNIKHILLKHIKNPLTKPRLYRAIWFGVMSFPLIGDEKLKIKPFEPLNKKHQLANHTLSYFDTPKFLIEVELSTGLIIRSPA